LLDRKLYLFDEVENSLDATSRKVLLSYILKEKERGKSFLIVSHNEEFIKTSDKAVLLCNGQITQE
jgi:ABC-type multidrug transport system ATPase subunit